MNPPAVRFLVITGLSGAGRRTAGHTLEDLGWYVVDNLPPAMLPGLLDIARDRGFDLVAVGVDVRSRSAFQEIPAAFDALGKAGVVPQILFLEASDQAIVRRQESVRRPLPLQGEGRILDGVQKEREMLGSLRGSADLVIDTSDLNVHQLSARIAEEFAPDADGDLHITLMSFGFKNGLPIDSDMVLDVRFLPNPHWVPALRPQTGLAQSVSSYVLGHPEAQDFLDHAESIIATITPGYVREGKRLATLAIGCTGGKHRSTAVVEELARRLREGGAKVHIRHRDLGLE